MHHALHVLDASASRVLRVLHFEMNGCHYLLVNMQIRTLVRNQRPRSETLQLPMEHYRNKRTGRSKLNT